MGIILEISLVLITHTQLMNNPISSTSITYPEAFHYLHSYYPGLSKNVLSPGLLNPLLDWSLTINNCPVRLIVNGKARGSC